MSNHNFVVVCHFILLLCSKDQFVWLKKLSIYIYIYYMNIWYLIYHKKLFYTCDTYNSKLGNMHWSKQTEKRKKKKKSKIKPPKGVGEKGEKKKKTKKGGDWWVFVQHQRFVV